MVGKNRMKDWQATVRTWASREKTPAPSKSVQNNPALNYTQRTETNYGSTVIDLLNEYGGEDKC
jgi:hypothetical protein